jgi:sugar O-acyltransferase (sialic acid O-acetyltransferase NeuD family)
MLIVGAKGFAKEVLEILHQQNKTENLVFYDDVNEDVNGLLFKQFKILKSEIEAKEYFEYIDNQFTIGIGTPVLRKKMYDKFTRMGGKFTSTISKNAKIGSYDNYIEKGVNIMDNVCITNSIVIKNGVIVNLNCTIGHDCTIGEFVELCPNVNISGNCNIDNYTFIGTSATILPNINIGKNVIIAAGSVVTKDVPDNCMVAGIPAVIKKEIPKIEFDE